MTRGVVAALIVAALAMATWAAVRLGRQDDVAGVVPAAIAVVAMQEFAGTGCASGALGGVAWSKLTGIGIPPGVLDVAAVSLLAASRLAAATPAWHAARLHPAVALRLV